jgi:DNA-binding NtrC family response regulator
MPNSLDPTNPLAYRETQLDPGINLDRPIPLKELTRQATRELERKIILKVLDAHRWNRTKSARTLCISYRTLLYKIKETGLLLSLKDVSTPAAPDAPATSNLARSE